MKKLLLFFIALSSTLMINTYAEEPVDLETYFINIENLLSEADKEYSAGNSDVAMNNAIKAYLDNFEYLEYDLEQHDEELMEKIETNLRQHLRDIIRNGESSKEVSTFINMIIDDLSEAKKLVLTSESNDYSVIESTSMDKEKPRIKGNSDISPLKQIDMGVIPEDVVCKSGFELLLNANNENPACVTQRTAQILIARGWGTSYD